jgi:precorrin-3B synthase
MSAPMPRGACPGLSAPMPTGDGLLVRLAPTEAVPVDAFIGLCAAARRHGNGIMEVTARSSLQVRGLTPRSAPLFGAETARLGIAASDGVPVLTNPLPDSPGAIIDVGLLAADVRRALAEAQLALAPKVSVVVDGGGTLHLDALRADVRLRAIGSREAPRLLLALQAQRFPQESTTGRTATALDLVSSGAAPALPFPARGERVGVRGRFHEFEPPDIFSGTQTRREGPSPGSRSLSLGRPKAGPVGDPTFLRTWGQVLLPPPERGRVGEGVAGQMRSAGGGAADPHPNPPPEAGGGSPAEEGGGTTWLGAVAPEHAVDIVLAILREIAVLGPQARAGDLLRSRGADALRVQFSITPTQPSERRPPTQMVGRHLLRDGSLALGIALPFGHAEADALTELARRAALYGARTIRPAPDRVLMLIGVPPASASGLAAAAAELGFIVEAADPRRRIAACAGAPACASGFIAARELAAAVAPRLAALPDGIAIHVSGCAKGCAHPAPASLTVVGDAQGCGIVRNDTARATPCRHVAPAELAGEVARVFAACEVVHG